MVSVESDRGASEPRKGAGHGMPCLTGKTKAAANLRGRNARALPHLFLLRTREAAPDEGLFAR